MADPQRPYTFPLSITVTKRTHDHATGTTATREISELPYRRPTVGDLCATDRAATDGERNLILLEAVSGWSAKDIDRLDFADINGAIAVIEELSPGPAEGDEPQAPEFERDGDAYIVPLVFPIKDGAGEEIDRITLRRPTGADVRAADQVKGPVSRAREMLARICELSKPQLNRIDAQDFYGLTVLVGHFTQPGRKAGKPS